MHRPSVLSFRRLVATHPLFTFSSAAAACVRFIFFFFFFLSFFFTFSFLFLFLILFLFIFVQPCPVIHCPPLSPFPSFTYPRQQGNAISSIFLSSLPPYLLFVCSLHLEVLYHLHCAHTHKNAHTHTYTLVHTLLPPAPPSLPLFSHPQLSHPLSRQQRRRPRLLLLLLRRGPESSLSSSQPGHCFPQLPHQPSPTSSPSPGPGRKLKIGKQH